MNKGGLHSLELGEWEIIVSLTAHNFDIIEHGYRAFNAYVFMVENNLDS